MYNRSQWETTKIKSQNSTPLTKSISVHLLEGNKHKSISIAVVTLLFVPYSNQVHLTPCNDFGCQFIVTKALALFCEWWSICMPLLAHTLNIILKTYIGYIRQGTKVFSLIFCLLIPNSLKL